jgi:hypothetical protein
MAFSPLAFLIRLIHTLKRRFLSSQGSEPVPPMRPPRHLLGREEELARLTDLAKDQGITVVAGRPQIGKSRVLEELKHRLTQEQVLVGFCESSGQEPDSLLRAVADAYSAWLATASWRAQANSLLQRHGRQQTTLALKLLTKLLQSTPGLSVADELLSILWSAGDDLRSPAPLRRLQYDQSMNLVSTLVNTSQRPVALILDGLEQSPDLRGETKALSAVLRHLDEWPLQFHIFVGLREPGNDDSAHDAWSELLQHAAVRRLNLDTIDFNRLSDARMQVLQLIRQWVPAAHKQSDQNLIDTLAGYPGTLSRWLRYRPDSLETLRQSANDAQRYHYSEIDQLLRSVCRNHRLRGMAIRLALISEFLSDEVWERFKPVLMGETDDSALLELQSRGLLDTWTTRPSFGHTTRYRAIQGWFLTEPAGIPFARAEAQTLVIQLCSQIRMVSQEEAPFVAALLDLAPRIARLPHLAEYEAPCRACQTLLDTRRSDSVGWAPALFTFARKHPEAVRLAAMALAEELRKATDENDQAYRVTLLNDLRQLAQGYPSDDAVQRALAKGLAMTAIYADIDKLADADALLTDLLQLVHTYPAEEGLRFYLAFAWSAIHTNAGSNLHKAAALLNAMRQLAENHPSDTAVRALLAKALFHALYNFGAVANAQGEVDLASHDALKELRLLAKEHPTDDAIRQQLANSLMTAWMNAEARSILTQEDALFDELAQLVESFPTDIAVRERFVVVLARMVRNASAKGSQLDTLITTLREQMQRCITENGAMSGRFSWQILGDLVGVPTHLIEWLDDIPTQLEGDYDDWRV